MVHRRVQPAQLEVELKEAQKSLEWQHDFRHCGRQVCVFPCSILYLAQADAMSRKYYYDKAELTQYSSQRHNPRLPNRPLVLHVQAPATRGENRR